MDKESLFIVQTSADDGRTWDDISKPLPEKEAAAKKREIDHNGPDGIDTLIVLA